MDRFEYIQKVGRARDLREENEKLKKRMAHLKRQYSAASVSRLTYSWQSLNTSSDTDIASGLAVLRGRSRDLAQNNDYAKRYLRMVVKNLIGAHGVRLQVKSRDTNGALDTVANKMIEAAWMAWSKKSSYDGQMSLLDIERVVVESVARDGEILIRRIRGKNAGNKYNYSLQMIEADHLDETYNDPSKNIKMGIQYDDIGKPINYYIWKYHPGDYLFNSMQRNERLIIPADEILHLYLKERPSQSRGVPWMHAAMTRLNNLGGYEEAEIIAARVGASKMGFITTPAPEDYDGEVDENGNRIMEAEPGTFEHLNVGEDIKFFDPTHPGGNFGPFMKSTLRGIAGGLNVSYAALANDLESVNFSSMRYGAIEERDDWMTLQSWFIHNFCIMVYEDFLDMALLSAAIPLPYAKYDKYNAPVFQGRRWQWVDPLKDVEANVRAVEQGLKTRSQVLMEQGLDFYEVVDELAKEQEYLKSKGILISDK